MRKIICIDVDGTLIFGEYKISDEIMKKMKLMDDFEFVVVSGRTVTELLELTDKYDLIGSNGGEIYKNGQFTKKLGFENHLAVEIIKWLEDYGYYAIVHTNEGRYIQTDVKNQVDMELDKILDEIGDSANIKRKQLMFDHVYGNVNKVENLKSFIAESKIHINKVETHFARDKKYAIETLEDLFSVDAFNSALRNLEIVPRGADKGIAISEYVGDEEAIIIAVGDGDNDISMFEVANISIAMGNATNTIKQMSNYEVADVEDDGFLEALEIIDNL